MVSDKIEYRKLSNGYDYGRQQIAVNYDKLWVIKKREMLKTDLIKAAKISTEGGMWRRHATNWYLLKN